MQCSALQTHHRRNARSRSMTNILNAHEVSTKKKLSKSNNLNLRAGRHLVQQKHGDEKSAMDYASGAHGFARALQTFISVPL
jgi:hypothetical protein